MLKGKKRVIFIGLDGVGLDLVYSLAQRGIMPFLSYLLKNNAGWGTYSCLPEVSPVCWTSIFTGSDSGQHGIFGFAHYRSDLYKVHLVDSTMVKLPRIWERLSLIGKRSVVLNVPLTYPVKSFNGIMVSGFVTPELTKAVYPSSLIGLLTKLNYFPEANLENARTNLAAFINEQLIVLEKRITLFLTLLAESWDFYLAVFTDTDRVNHFLLPALFYDNHPQADLARRVYRLIDDFISRVFKIWSNEIKNNRCFLIIAADHSFGPIYSEIYLNSWLINNGYLKVLEGGQSLEKYISPSTKAVCLDPNRIYLNQSSRFSKGNKMSLSEIHFTLCDIRDRLLALRFKRLEKKGRYIKLIEIAPIKAVHLNSDIYHGPQAYLGPDLVVEANFGFSLRAGFGKDGIFGLSYLTGAHYMYGALALTWPPLSNSQRPNNIQRLYNLIEWALDIA